MKPDWEQLKHVMKKASIPSTDSWNIYYYLPDLIVEVTDACDRTCSGCYAPNILVRPNSSEVLSVQFLTPSQFRNALEQISLHANATISFRGGEPTLSPHLEELIQIALSNHSIPVLETHGRWLLNFQRNSNQLIDLCKSTGLTLKISADSMHRMQLAQLTQILDILNRNDLTIFSRSPAPSKL